MLNEDWFAMQNPIGPDVLICRPGFTEFALQTHTYCWSFVSTCADDLCQTLTDHRECNNGLSIASAACSTELGRPSASNNETTHSNKRIEDDAGNCFMLPTALRERITQQPTSLLKFLIHCESMLIAPRMQAFRRSFDSSCAVEQDTTEACNGRNNIWQSTFASCPLKRGRFPRNGCKEQASTTT